MTNENSPVSAPTDDATGESRRVLWRRRPGPAPRVTSGVVSPPTTHPTNTGPTTLAEYEHTIKTLSQRVVLLEEALRTDRDLSLVASPVHHADRPGSTCFVWDAEGSLMFEHVGEPALFVRPSVSASRLNAAIALARSDAENGHLSVDVVQIYGPPRRDLVVIGEALYNRAQPVDDNTKAAGVVVRVIDITPQRRMEEIRRDFVTNISHELRTPVGAIGVLAEMIAGEPSAELRDRMVGRLEIESSRLARMIDDLLELAVAEASDPVVNQAFDVMDGVSAALDRIEPGAQAKSIAIELVSKVGSTPTLVRGTAPQLASALHNLLDNAVKYSDDRSVVFLEVDALKQNDAVTISVIDEGAGIPSRDRERIFERFYRVDPARARATGGAGGTGLGLSIVRHLVTNMGGTVQVHSIEGHGSTFSIVLPKLASDPATPASLT